MTDEATQPKAPERAYGLRDFGRLIAMTIAFLSIWFACIAVGFIIPMTTLDHGDVASALMAYICTGIAIVVGPVIAILIIRSVQRRT